MRSALHQDRADGVHGTPYMSSSALFWRSLCGGQCRVGGHAEGGPAQARRDLPRCSGPVSSSSARSSSGTRRETAIVICDMWDQHWCKGASERVAELAPVMNRVVSAARDKGVLIVHSPSGTIDHYKDHPARQTAMQAPKAAQSARGHRLLVPVEGRDGEEGRLPHRPLRRRLRLPAAVQGGLALDRPDRLRSRSRTGTRSATPASRSGTCWRPGASRT